MPKRAIDLQHQIDYLSILDEDGRVDTALEPDIPAEQLVHLYHALLLARRLDERMLNMQRQGRIGTFPPTKGMEATHLGAIAAIDPEDWFVPQFRELGAELYRGRKPESALLHYAGYDEGLSIPEDQKNLPISVIVAGQLPYAVGIAYTQKYRKTGRLILTFTGDGGTSEGDFHEALNIAAVFQVPLILVIQNNQWAISTPRSKQTHSETLAQKAIAYGMPGIQVDGNDILAVYVAMREAVARARAGDGPSLIESVTYRVIMHSTSDDPSRYRTDDEVKVWLQRDPLLRFQRYLLDKGVLAPEAIEAQEAEVKAEIQSAVEGAERHMKEHADPLAIFEHLYAEPTLALQEQREEFMRELAADADADADSAASASAEEEGPNA